MPTANPARAAKLSAAMDKGFGELFTFSARKFAANGDVNLPRIADGSRANFDISGVWSAGSRIKNIPARGRSDNQADAAVAAAPSVTVEDAVLAVNWTPIEGDLCTRQIDGSIYSVSRGMPDSFGRTKYYLTAKKR